MTLPLLSASVSSGLAINLFGVNPAKGRAMSKALPGTATKMTMVTTWNTEKYFSGLSRIRFKNNLR